MQKNYQILVTNFARLGKIWIKTSMDYITRSTLIENYLAKNSTNSK